MTENELNEIEARANAATFNSSSTLAIGVVTENGKAAFSFLNHAREDIPALIAEVRQLRAERDVLIKIYTDRDWCPREWFDDDEYDCDLSQCNATTKKCWLEWVSNEVEKAEES